MSDLPKLHPLTLSFDDPVHEAAWWRHFAIDKGALYKGGVGFLYLVMIAFGAIDYLAYGAVVEQLWLIRYAFAMPLLLLAAPKVFGKHNDDFLALHAQELLLYLALVALISLVPMGWIIAPALDQNDLLATCLSMLFAMMCLMGASRLRFLYAAPLGIGFTALYFVVMGLRASPDSLFFVITMIFGAGALLIGLPMCWALEFYARRSFSLELSLEGERARADELLLNIMPARLAAQLKERPGSIAERLGETTVMFARLVGFDEATQGLSPLDAVALLDRIVARFDALALDHGVERIKTIGATYMAASGVPDPQPNHAASMARLALALREETAHLRASEGLDLWLQAGICSGPVMAGVIGRTRFAFDLWGDTANTAARLESHGLPEQIQISASTELLLRGRFRMRPRPHVELKGKGQVEAFWLEGR